MLSSLNSSAFYVGALWMIKIIAQRYGMECGGGGGHTLKETYYFAEKKHLMKCILKRPLLTIFEKITISSLMSFKVDVYNKWAQFNP